MKEQIKEIAVELLIRHGYQGFRFRDVADRLETTRANVHYYYGSKLNLSEEVIVDYVHQTLANWEKNWTSNKSFEQKIRGMMEFEPSALFALQPKGDDGLSLEPHRPHAHGAGRHRAEGPRRPGRIWRRA